MKQKSKSELAEMHWRERYEYEAQLEADTLQQLDEAVLIARIRDNRLDPYFAIWRAIGEKGTVKGSALALWQFLQKNPGDPKMLHRFHCAAALFKILGIADPASKSDLRRQVQWDHAGEPARQEALLRLKQIIIGKLTIVEEE